MKDLKASSITALADEISNRVPYPVDLYEIASILESMGLTDQSAQQHYRASDVFGLAEAILVHLRAKGLFRPVPYRLIHVALSWRHSLMNYMRGVFAFVPSMIILVFIYAVSLLGEWKESQVLALSFGITGSLLTTSGLVQATARRTLTYVSRNDIRSASHFLRMAMGISWICVIFTAFVLLGLGTLLSVFTPAERIIFTLSYTAIATIWLLVSALALVQKLSWIVGGMAAGLAVTLLLNWILMPFSELHLALSAVAAFAVTLGLILYAFQRAFPSMTEDQSQEIALPSIAYLMYEAAPYFGYGLANMLFILWPRVLNWLAVLFTGQEQRVAIIILEVGLIVSLPPLVLSWGVLENAVRSFWQYASIAQTLTPGSDHRHFGRQLTTFYQVQLKRYVVVLALWSLVVYMLFRAGILDSFLTGLVPLNDDFAWVFSMSLVAYAILSCGSFNCMFLLSLDRPALALGAVILGMITSLIYSSPSLNFGPSIDVSIIAFTAGTVVFAAVSTWSITQVLESADYYFFVYS